MDSILTSVKKLLMIAEDDHSFDADIIVLINGAIFALGQLGLGAARGFSIADDIATWDDLLGGAGELEAVKTYIYLKVRAVFDPPASSAVSESLKHAADEAEWRVLAELDGN